MANKTISLLIPCYKCADFITDVLDSAKNQSDLFDEVICYVDGCPNNTFDAVERYKKNCMPSLIIHHNKVNHGLTFSRNQLLQAAKSDYVSFQDSDDPLHKDFVKIMRQNLHKKTVTLCRLTQQEINGKTVIQGKVLNVKENPVNNIIQQFYHLNSAVFHKRFLLEIGGSFEKLGLYEDVELVLRFALEGGKVKIIPDLLAFWIKRPGSLMHTTSWESHNSDLSLMTENLAKYFIQQPISTQKIWRNYLAQKIQMVYFNTGWSKHFNSTIKHITPLEKNAHNYLLQIIGYRPYLFVLKLYSKISLS